MSIKQINMEVCTGCGKCIDACAMDVIRMDEETQKAVIKYPEDCMLCLYCEAECPTNAIYVSPELLERPLLSWG
jgi:NAD-dependent dihydropyrimidine dehydrogenase PreA subunit